MTLMKEERPSATSHQGRHILTSDDVQKAHSPEALKKRRRTLAEKREARLLDVADCHGWGMVLTAISDYLGISDGYTRKLLREAKARGLLR
jgi:hypothetical protein